MVKIAFAVPDDEGGGGCAGEAGEGYIEVGAGLHGGIGWGATVV